MARPGGGVEQDKQPTIRGSGLWLIAAYAATVFWLLGHGWREAVVETMLDHWWVVPVAWLGWSLAGRILGGILRAMGQGKAPGWVFLFSGWTVATLAAGAILALQFTESRLPSAALDDLKMGLITFAVLGALWVVLVDLPRLGLWRLSRRSQPPFLAVPTLAVLGGLGATAWVVMSHLDGELGRPPLEGASGVLAMVLGAAVVLTLLLELPRALVQRGATAQDAPERPKPKRERPGQRDLAPPSPQAPSATVVGRPHARVEHARLETPPTVVRR